MTAPKYNGENEQDKGYDSEEDRRNDQTSLNRTQRCCRYCVDIRLIRLNEIRKVRIRDGKKNGGR